MVRKQDQISSSNGVLVVLGCRAPGALPSAALSRRLEMAWQFHLQEPKLVGIVFSGCGREVDIIEAEVMRKWWLQRSRKQGKQSRLKLFLESQSRTTEQNAIFTARLLKHTHEFPNEPSLVYLVTCDYHLARATRLFRRQKLEIVGLGAISPHSFKKFWSLYAKERLSELLGTTKFWMQLLQEKLFLR